MSEPCDTVLVVDDDENHAAAMVLLLRRAGYDAIGFTSAAAAISHVRRTPPALVVTDVFMPEMDGFEVLREVRAIADSLPVLAISGSSIGCTDFLRAMEAFGAAATLTKPVDEVAFLRGVEGVLGRTPQR
jgi:CheY-like chemotaxis protein